MVNLCNPQHLTAGIVIVRSVLRESACQWRSTHRAECSCEKICPVFPVPRNTVCCPIGKFKVFLCLRWHSVPPFNFVANKKASSPFGLLAMESTLFLFVFCGKLFCRFQQSFKGLLFFRLLNQFYEKCTENIGAVMPGRCGNLVDEVM